MAENRSKEACLDDGISSHIILKTPADFNIQLAESPVDFSQRKEYNKSGKAGRTLSAGCDLDGSRLFQFGARTRGGSGVGPVCERRQVDHGAVQSGSFQAGGAAGRL